MKIHVPTYVANTFNDQTHFSTFRKLEKVGDRFPPMKSWNLSKNHNRVICEENIKITLPSIRYYLKLISVTLNKLISGGTNSMKLLPTNGNKYKIP